MLEHITISIVVANLPDPGLIGRDLLKASDEALYRAKAEGPPGDSASQ